MIRDSRVSSLLYMMYECPYIDVGIAGSLFKHPYNALSKLMNRKLIESFDSMEHNLIGRKGYKLSEIGLDHVRGMMSNEGLSKRTSKDESYRNGLLFPTYIPVMHKGLQRGGMTHFRSLHLMYLWLQLRWFKPQEMSLLWDNVRARDHYPLIGNPDLIFFDEIDFINGQFKDLMMVEFEMSEKSDVTVFDRIDTLTKNKHVMLLIVSPDRKTIKSYVNSFRKALPMSNYFNGNRQFGESVISDTAYQRKIWFLEWDPVRHNIQGAEIGKAIAKRADHPDFDVLGEWKYRADGSAYQEYLKHDRWDGDYEFPLEDLLEAFR